MRVNRGLLGWGVFLIAFGAEALLIRSGRVDAGLASRALEAWPLLLIAVGLDLILRRSPVSALGTIAVALVFAAMAGALIATTPIGGQGSVFCGGVATGGDAATQFPPTGSSGQGTLGATAAVSITADCGTIALDAIDGSDYHLVWRGSDSSLAPAVNASDSSLTLRRNPTGGVNVGTSAINWSVTLPRAPLLNLDLRLNAGSATADLGGLRIATLVATVNAGNATINLAGATETTSVTGSANAGTLSISLPAPTGTLSGTLTANAGTVRLCVPAGSGLRIRVSGETLASDNFGQRGLTSQGDTWARPGFDTSASRIDLVVAANLGTITLNPEEGCV